MNIEQLLGQTQSQATKAVGKKELGQDDFMKLLVAQMQNQDPSNPADNAQFMSQIAQFTMVDGIENLNTSFDSLAGNFFTNQAISAADLVGRQVLNETNTGFLNSGQKMDGSIFIPEFTDGLNIQVRDDKGALIKTIDSTNYKEGIFSFSWDGANEQGEIQPDGEYTINATALVDGNQEALPVALYNTVESISMSRSNNGVLLDLDNNQHINFSSISQYR